MIFKTWLCILIVCVTCTCVYTDSENNWQVDDVLDILQRTSTSTTIRPNYRLPVPPLRRQPSGISVRYTRPSTSTRPYWYSFFPSTVTNTNLFATRIFPRSGVRNIKKILDRRLSFQPREVIIKVLPRGHIQGVTTAHVRKGFVSNKPMNYDAYERDIGHTGHATTTEPSNVTDDNDGGNNYIDPRRDS